MKDKKPTAPDGRANRIILGRTIALMCVFGVLAFAPLLWKLWQIQMVDGDRLEKMAIEQQTRDMTVTAPRGTIYDARGNILAISDDVQNVVISPKDLLALQKSWDDDYAGKFSTDGVPARPSSTLEVTPEELQARQKAWDDSYKGKVPKDGIPPRPDNNTVAAKLAEILEMDQAAILKRMENTKSQYEVLKWRVEDEVSTRVRQLMVDNKLYPGVFLSPDTKRVYPYGSLAAQVVGWVNPNDENRGAYGLEAYREELLAGKAGRVVSSKNAAGTEMLSTYENYVDPVSGNNLHLTIDATIQSFCTKALVEGIETFEIRKGAFCIVMNPKTGAVLADVSLPEYDLNNPRTISDPTLAAYLESVKNDPNSSEEAYGKALEAAQYQQWRNKSLGDTYEPGSTFKIMVLAAALEEGVVNESTHFYCSGAATVADRTMRCSKREGHKDQDLRKAVMNSCNPAFMAIGQKLGAEKFYQYFEDFGFLEKTGIDLQGEAGNTLFWEKEKFIGPYGLTNLATASFGQRFQITPFQLITAVSASVNGGHLMRPYVVQSVTDNEGKLISNTTPTEVRQVISEETSALVRSILESVVGDGGTGKNAYVPGYRIGGKTGTSETIRFDSVTGAQIDDEYIVSFVAVAPADDPQIVVLLAYDTPTPAYFKSPTTAKGHYISGGNMAAPMAKNLMADILDYMGVEKQYKPGELAGADVPVPKAVGLSLKDAETLLQNKGFTFRTVGDGAVVTGQLPAQGTILPGSSQIVLYLGIDAPTEQVAVPDVSGKSPEAVQSALTKLGLYMRVTGATTGTVVAGGQRLDPGTMVDPGTVVEVSFIDTQIQDFARGNG